MATIAITNVRRFDDGTVDRCSKIAFKASPGNVMDIDSQPDETIDGTGCTVMPGLIDSKIDADASLESLHKFATHGITTVIDLSSGSIHCETMRSASLEAPGLTSYMFAGSGIGSHDHESSSAFQHRAIRGISSGEEANDLVAQDSIGHSQTNFVRLVADVPGLDDSTLLSAADAAHRRGKLVIAYASQADTYRRALQIGFDIITPAPNDGPLDPDVVAGLAASNIAVIPTLCFQKHLMSKGNPGLSQAMENVKTLYDAGVQICAGTCANEQGGMGSEFGASLHEELHLLVEAGLPPREALRSATYIPAKVFGLSDRASLEPGGHRADLVLVEGDPSKDIAAASRIRRVWIQGIEVLREV